MEGPPPGDGVGAAAVQIGLAPDADDGEHQRDGTGGLQVQIGRVPPGDGEIFRLPGVQIGHHRLRPARIGGEGVVVKGNQLVGDSLIGEPEAEVGAVPGVRQVAKAHVALVVGIVANQLQIPAALPGEVADAVGYPGGDPQGVVRQWELPVQESVAHAGGVDGPQGSALQDQRGFHGITSITILIGINAFSISSARYWSAGPGWSPSAKRPRSPPPAAPR